jgi:hypothetical protein
VTNEPLPNPLDQLEDTDDSGGRKVTRVDKLIVVMLTSEAVQGKLEVSLNEIVMLLIQFMNHKLPGEDTPSRSEILSSVERLVVKDIVRKRSKGTATLYALRVLIEAARSSWGDETKVEKQIESREI